MVPLLPEALPLVDPKAVLLVGDRQAEIGVLNVVLNQGVGPDDQVDVTTLDGVPELTVLFGRQRSGQQADVDMGPSKGFG